MGVYEMKELSLKQQKMVVFMLPEWVREPAWRKTCERFNLDPDSFIAGQPDEVWSFLIATVNDMKRAS
jgi:hypothetical protein